MTREKTDIFAAVDLPAALGLLTRLPVPVDGDAAIARGARSAWAWPAAGAVVGLMAGLLAWIAIAAGLPAAIAALLAIGGQALVTGAMHEDGLADSLDGLWGGWTRERRLEIMKDSHIGAFGVIGLIAAVALRWQVAAHLLDGGLHPVAIFVALAAASRSGMVALMAILPPARPGGLSARAGQPPPVTVALALGLGLLFAALALGPVVLPMILGMGLACALWAIVALRKIGGQTGDILGAGQQVIEIAGGLVLLALLG